MKDLIQQDHQSCQALLPIYDLVRVWLMPTDRSHDSTRIMFVILIRDIADIFDNIVQLFSFPGIALW